MTFTLLDETRAVRVEGTVAGERVALAPEGVEQALGWAPKPQGLCRGEHCIPAPGLVRDGRIDLATLARLLGRPLALDVAEGAACLGAAAEARARRLASLEAPDFTLPDLDGRPHALSDHRGRKVFLLAWASW